MYPNMGLSLVLVFLLAKVTSSFPPTCHGRGYQDWCVTVMECECLHQGAPDFQVQLRCSGARYQDIFFPPYDTLRIIQIHRCHRRCHCPVDESSWIRKYKKQVVQAWKVVRETCRIPCRDHASCANAGKRGGCADDLICQVESTASAVFSTEGTCTSASTLQPGWKRDLDDMACPCNSTYVSKACCGIENGLVHEPTSAKLGELELT